MILLRLGLLMFSMLLLLVLLFFFFFLTDLSCIHFTDHRVHLLRWHGLAGFFAGLLL